MLSQIKGRKHIEQNFHSVAGVMPQGWDSGVLGGGQKFQRGDLRWRPSTAHSSFFFFEIFAKILFSQIALKEILVM